MLIQPLQHTNFTEVYKKFEFIIVENFILFFLLCIGEMKFRLRHVYTT